MENPTGRDLFEAEWQRIADGDGLPPTRWEEADIACQQSWNIQAANLGMRQDIAVSIEVLRRNARYMTESAKTCRDLAAAVPQHRSLPEFVAKYNDQADSANALVASYTRVADWLESQFK